MATDIEQLRDTVKLWNAGGVSATHLRSTLANATQQNATLLGSRLATYEQVLDQIMARIEAAANFTVESCSFSHGDFAQALNDWLDKLELRIRQAND